MNLKEKTMKKEQTLFLAEQVRFPGTGSNDLQTFVQRKLNQQKGTVQIEEAIDFATNPDKVFWPFNDEFWKDELGGYIYTETGSCQE